MAAQSSEHKNVKSTKPRKFTSSPGDSPADIVPREITPDNATWKDRTERNIYSEDIEEKADALLDEASDLSFPASDPIAVSSISRIEKKPERTGRPTKSKA